MSYIEYIIEFAYVIPAILLTQYILMYFDIKNPHLQTSIILFIGFMWPNKNSRKLIFDYVRNIKL